MKNTHDYRLICGMEIHAELKTKSKMFCGCKNDPFHAPAPNTYTCPVCLGMPGGTPVANKTAVDWTIKLGLALGCKINLFSKFDRKNYFYPDLPKGYQISQYDIPFCVDGVVQTSEGPVRIRRIHLEEDTGKLLHTTVAGEKVTLIDFNRSGVPLIEIVTEPDIRTPSQAKEYGRKLRQIIRYLDIADADMEQGGMRLEANISLAPAKADELPKYKVEVKNINSFRFVEQAITYEMKRHAEILSGGGTPEQETRGWNPNTGKTFSQRAKEETEDYRYFPDPDLPPIRLKKQALQRLKAELPELPDMIVSRWHTTYQVEPRFGELLNTTREQASWIDEIFLAAAKEGISANSLASAIVNRKIKTQIGDKPKDVLATYYAAFATEKIDASELDRAIEKVFAANPDAVAKYKAGDQKVIGFFIGQVIREIGRKADANEVRQALIAALK